jgi:hypothetical protein
MFSSWHDFFGTMLQCHDYNLSVRGHILGSSILGKVVVPPQSDWGDAAFRAPARSLYDMCATQHGRNLGLPTNLPQPRRLSLAFTPDLTGGTGNLLGSRSNSDVFALGIAGNWETHL